MAGEAGPTLHWRVRQQQNVNLRRREDVERLLTTAREKGRESLLEPEARELAASYGIPLAAYRVASTVSAASRAAIEIGFPVVVKGVVPALLHKSEKGAVRLGLETARAVATACEDMAARLAPQLEGFIIEEMVAGGLDLLIGVSKDPIFGEVVCFGLGGTLVEFLRLVEFRLIPLSVADARKLIRHERLGLTKESLRGQRVNDFAELETVLLAVAGESGLVQETAGHLDQFELNPIRLTQDRLVALDVKLTLRKA